MNIHSVTILRLAATVQQSPDKREAILDAALELFAERTFDGTAVPLIAERAGVAAGTIYRYFDSKEALVNALYRRWKGELRRRAGEAIAAGGTHEERFRADLARAVAVRGDAAARAGVPRDATPRVVPRRREPRARAR